MAFRELCCRSGGSNLNAGTKAGDSVVPGVTADYATTNGNWNGTSVFTPTDGSTPASTINPGDFVSVFLDGATVGVYIAQVASVAVGINGAITLSTTVKAGTPPASGATGRSLRCGGALKGPNGAEDFPVDLATLHTLGVVASQGLRINFMNDATYSITAVIAPSSPAAGVFLSGFSSAYGDDGLATIDGGTAGASYQLLNNTVAWWVTNFILQNNGATGNAHGCGTGFFRRVCVNSVRGCGWLSPSGLEECEGYACNQSNTVNFGAVQLGTINLVRCIFHDNPGSNNSGIVVAGSTAAPTFIQTIFDTNQVHIRIPNNGGQLNMIGCDFYNSASHSLIVTRNAAFMLNIDNSNFVLSGGYFIDASGMTGNLHGHLINCGFGSGTKGATSGQYTGLQSVRDIDPLTYDADVTPWADPDNGDFQIVLPAAKASGRGSFLQTAAGYAGAIGYPARGAAQPQASGGGGRRRQLRMVC